MSFIDSQRRKHGVEPMCKMLPIAPSTYYEHRARQVDPQLLPDRAKRARSLICARRSSVCGIHNCSRSMAPAKVWLQLNREKIPSGPPARWRRLMRDMGLRGAVRGKKCKTTVPDESAARPADLVNRDFNATAPQPVCGWLT